MPITILLLLLTKTNFSSLGSRLLTITNEQEYDKAVERLNLLLDEIGDDESHPLYSLLDTLSIIIEAYDNQHYPLPHLQGIDALIYLMEEHSLSQLACARTQWLKELLIEYLPQLIPLTNSDRDLDTAKLLDTAIKQQFIERGLTSPAQQKNRITDVRNAIKVFDPQHPTLDIVGLSKVEWVEVNTNAVFNTYKRETQFLTNPNAIVQTALSLIKSDRWSEIAAGLAVVTGRRISDTNLNSINDR